MAINRTAALMSSLLLLFLILPKCKSGVFFSSSESLRMSLIAVHGSENTLLLLLLLLLSVVLKY